jgi:ferric-dicitrate binding protein FerR (iron transport regulator)
MKRLISGLGAGAAALLTCALFAQRLSAESRPAQVSALEGQAERSRANAPPSKLAVGAAIAQGDIITTFEDARLELKFADASLLRIGPKAKLQITAAHFGGGPARRQMTARLFFGDIWARVTSVIQGEQKFQIETENAVAGVRGTTFRVDARQDKSVLVRVYAGAVAVAKNVPIYATGKPGERREVAGPDEVSRDQWEKIVGKQMQILIAADGTPGEPGQMTEADEKGDDLGSWKP